ncbi:MAG: NAD(+) synthase, partial [Solobacterium sp.]|nr:NAD(+) synthase [Solobacterium sp.]
SACMDESSTDLVFSGHAMIADSGSLLKESIFENDICLDALIDLDKISYNRTHQTTFENQPGFTRIPALMPALKADNSEELAERLIAEQAMVARNPFIPSDTDEMAMRCEKILRIQAHGLATRVRATGIRKLVIGISGGLDSTLALIVCHEAARIEKDIHIIAVTMPSQGNTTSLTYNNAMGLMKALADEIRVVPIGDTVRMHLSDIGHAGSYQGEGDTAYENAQARMRTSILMDIANMENGLVVGTGDLSELALGWCTYNGDHMSMYGVNASVPKTLVKFICRSYALTCGDEALKDILFSIADTPISPELTPSKDGQIAQKTEDKIGKYDLNDFFLFYTLRYGMEPKKLLAYAYAAYHELPFADLVTALQRFYRRFFSQQFKRSCLPDGPKVGSVTLSPRGDWRMPSDAAVSLWLRETGQAAEKEE